ncbi:beta strand repeat-containing protein [Fulvivirga sediminis]|uniref:Gliding motility-associated C-terminal domain-containing protein n=1 Tax=Fulvivirga sediminis TaxID=2803949 RepID=A0A937K2D5_9BACT|nr:Calx-beta domain-containing protein [Fulvivirga sediminis]MBL3658255.1 gliding motility-associated C-terminal domain-containing protein [Fulvivirga sediminis]
MGTTTFDDPNLTNIAPYAPAPRSGTVQGWSIFVDGAGSGSINHNGSTTPSTVSVYIENASTINLASEDGSEFALNNFRAQFYNFAGSYVIDAYRNGVSVGSASASASSSFTVVDLSANTNFQNIDEFRFTNFGGSNVTIIIDEITISPAVASNTPPSASSFTASNGPFENLTYTFSTADFSYNDSDGDPLNQILLENIPTAGTLYVDADNDDSYDGGEEVGANDMISKADLDAGNLQYIQNGATPTSFQFEVNDGTTNSNGNYIATLNILGVPTVTLSISPSSRQESNTTASIITATLSNVYGATTDVTLGFGGTSTLNSDYTVNSSTISIGSGNTTGSTSMVNIPDALYESNETVIIDILSVTNGTENGTQQETFTIIDDDSPPLASLLLRDIYNPIVDESGGQAYIVGVIDAPAGITVVIPLSFKGTASGGGTDYSITGSSITLSPGETMDSIRLTSQYDGIEDGNETVIIEMLNPTNATENGTQEVTLTIIDEDATPPGGYSVSLDQSVINNANESSVSFTFASAEVGATYNYTFSSSGGGTNVTGSGTINTSTDQITGIDLSGLNDGTITLSATLTDPFGSTGAAATDIKVKDTSAPSGYSASIDQSAINSGNETTVSFTFAGAEIGATYNYTFSSSGGGTNVTGSGTVTTATDQITGINLSGLGDGTITLTATLTDIAGNAGGSATDTKTKDTIAPSGYTVSIDQSPINNINENSISFTLAGAEVSATYFFTLSSSGGGTNVTGSGTVATASDQITGLDISGLNDGTITLSITLIDVTGNTGSAATDTEIKDTSVPTGYSVAIDQSSINSSNENNVSFTFTGAEVGTTYNYTFSSSGGGTNVTGSGVISTSSDQVTGINISGLGDGTITLSVTLTDGSGNVGATATDTKTKDTTAPSGYTVSFDQMAVNGNNSNSISFTFSGAEIGTNYNYTISSSGGGTNVTGSGSIFSATQQVSGIDLSALNDGTLTLSVTLTDNNSNTGSATTDTVIKDTVPSTGYSVNMDLLGETIINVINQNIIEFQASGLETGTTLNYSFTSNNGGTPVTGTETVATSTQQFNNSGAGYDLSGLSDGTVTLTISLTDAAGNTGSNATDNEAKDSGPPTGYSVAWDDTFINSTEAASASFTISGAEIGTTANYSIFSSGDGNTFTVTGSRTINTSTQSISVDVSSLTNGNLTVQVSLSDTGGNTGSTRSDNSAVLDQNAPSGYTVTIDQLIINSINEAAVSFTFSSAEIGATYNYTFSSDGGGSNITGSGTISSANEQVTGIDLSALADGTISLSVTITDQAGNSGPAATDNTSKDTTIPTFNSVDDGGGDNSYTSGESLTISVDMGESSLNVVADLSIINPGFSSTATFTDNGDGTYTITIADVDAGGNLIENPSLSIPITVTDGAGNKVTDNSLTLNLDKTPPSGYTVSIDQSLIDQSNHQAISFQIGNAEAASFNYTISSSGSGTPITGSGSISSPPSQAVGPIDVSTLHDGILTVAVTLTDAAGNTGSAANDMVDKEAALIAFNTSNSEGSEATSTPSVTVDLSIASANTISVDYAVSSGTATGSGTDYTLASGTLNIPAGSTSGTIDISIVNDNLVEDNETIIITLTNPTNATLGGIVEHTYTILDDDQKLAQTITFAPIPDKRVGADPIVLQATGGGSNEPVTFSITTSPSSGVATLSNGVITILGVGSVTVTASQAGNDFYEAAADVSQTFVIQAGEFFLPTLFSPNNDGTNDLFLLRGGADVQEITLSIYDREGNEVFSSTNLNTLMQQGWDGTSEGKEQPQGAYVWVIKGTFSDGSALTINGKDAGVIRLAR